MGRPRECADLVRQGLSPDEIAGALGRTRESVLDYLDRAIRRGLLTKYEVLFTIPEERRRQPEDSEAVAVVERYGKDAHVLGDTYELLRRIEVHLHREVLALLRSMFGTDEHGWWRQGVPLNVRKKCQGRREENNEPVEPCRYMDLLDLREVMKANWDGCKELTGSVYRDNRKRFHADLEKVNDVRRKVMHPLRGDLPEEGDLLFLNEVWKRIPSS